MHKRGVFRFKSFRREDSFEMLFKAQNVAALENLKNAESYFNMVSDQNLVEYAVLEMEAASRFYKYTLEKEKKLP